MQENINTEEALIKSVHHNKLEKFFIDKGVLDEMKEEFFHSRLDVEGICDASFDAFITENENDGGAVNRICMWNESLRYLQAGTKEQSELALLFWFNLSQEWRLKCKENA